VAGLGEFSSMEPFLSLGNLMKLLSSPNMWATFTLSLSSKIKIWRVLHFGRFFTKASGHPVPDVYICKEIQRGFLKTLKIIWFVFLFLF
jgi:hypothetical protein